MREQGTISERIQRTRIKLEERFNVFERSLFQELGAQSRFREMMDKKSIQAAMESSGTVSLPARNESSVTESSRGVASCTDHEREILQLRKAAQDLEARNRTQDETIEHLRESLKVMGTERQELLTQLHNLEEQLHSAQEISGTSSKELIVKLESARSENDLLKETNQDLYQRRKKSLTFWKKWVHVYRARKNLVKTDTQESQKLTKHVTKLTGELDSAFEMIAELRDELHGVGRMKNSPQNK